MILTTLEKQSSIKMLNESTKNRINNSAENDCEEHLVGKERENYDELIEWCYLVNLYSLSRYSMIDFSWYNQHDENYVSVISQFSGIFVIQFSPIKAQKKQPKLQFYDIWVPKCHRIFEVLFRIGGSIIFVHMKTDSIVDLPDSEWE